MEDILANVLAYGVTAAVAGVVAFPLYYFTRSRRFLPMQRLRPGHWSGREAWLAFFIYFFAVGLATNLLEGLGLFEVKALFENPPSTLRMALWSWPLATLLTLAIIFWEMFVISRTRPSDLGLTLARWPQNSVLGYLGFVVLTPLILGFYYLVLLLYQRLFGSTPQAHELEVLTKESLPSVEWALLFFQAIIAAPITEELLFRGILQGWLRRATLVGHITLLIVTVACGMFVYINSLFENPAHPGREPSLGPPIFSIFLALGYGVIMALVWNIRPDIPQPIRSEDQKEQKLAVEEISLIPTRPGSAWARGHVFLSIYGSAMVFAVFHSTVWPSPIPLFPLGMGLGYLAYRTQSLVPGIVTHGLFNVVACLVLLFAKVR